jgi:hypothetical protein
MSGATDASIAVAVSAGALRIGPLKQTCATSSCYNGIYSAAYDLTGAGASVQAAIAPSASHASSMLTVLADGQNHYRIWSEAYTLSFEKKIGGAKTELKSIPYDPVNHAFWRIRHDAATDAVVFETAPSLGGTPGAWMLQTSTSRQVAVTGMRVELKAGTYQVETVAPGAVAFDHVLVTK